MQIEHPVTKQAYRFWFENAVVTRPIKDGEGSAASADQRLFPRECREAVSLVLPSKFYYEATFVCHDESANYSDTSCARVLSAP